MPSFAVVMYIFHRFFFLKTKLFFAILTFPENWGGKVKGGEIKEEGEGEREKEQAVSSIGLFPDAHYS